MVELYTSKGISEDDAEFVVNTLFKYKEFFIDHMMVVELGE
jgi:DNA damage-binding protein 1